MYGNEDSFGPTFASALTTVLSGYLMGSWFKRKPGSYLPMLTEGVLAVGGLGLRNKIHHPYGSAISEGLGYGGTFGLGEVVAANTKTIGDVVAGPIPMNRSASTASPAVVRGNPAVVRGNPAVIVRNPVPQTFVPGYNYGFSYEASA